MAHRHPNSRMVPQRMADPQVAEGIEPKARLAQIVPARQTVDFRRRWRATRWIDVMLKLSIDDRHGVLCGEDDRDAHPIGGGQAAVREVEVDVVGVDHLRPDRLEGLPEGSNRGRIVQGEIRPPPLRDLRPDGVHPHACPILDGRRLANRRHDVDLVPPPPKPTGQGPGRLAGPAYLRGKVIARQEDSHPQSVRRRAQAPPKGGRAASLARRKRSKSREHPGSEGPPILGLPSRQ
jgi:hypothetical protein